MKSIKPEDKLALEALQKRLSQITERLIDLLQNNKITLNPGSGAKFFSENAEIASVNSEFFENRAFQNKLESFMKFSLIVNRLSSEYLASASSLLTANPKLSKDDKERLFDQFETATRKYFNSLNKTNQLLADLISNRLNKTSLLKAPNIDENILTLNSLVQNLEFNVMNFSESLERVSKQLVENAIQDENDGPEEQHPDILNFKTAIDSLEHQYKTAYDQSFGLSGFWRKIKESLQNSDRALEIKFLKDISDHPKTNDAIRYQAMTLVHNKINKTELFGENSHLRKILHKLLSSGVRGFENEENDLNQFMDEHPEIQMPTNLSHYFEKHNNEYSNDTVGLI